MRTLWLWKNKLRKLEWNSREMFLECPMAMPPFWTTKNNPLRTKVLIPAIQDYGMIFYRALIGLTYLTDQVIFCGPVIICIRIDETTPLIYAP